MTPQKSAFCKKALCGVFVTLVLVASAGSSYAVPTHAQTIQTESERIELLKSLMMELIELLKQQLALLRGEDLDSGERKSPTRHTGGGGGGNNTTPPDPPGDVTAPVISAVVVSEPVGSGVTITWTTDELSDSQVEYGTTIAYGETSVLDATMVTSHSVTLTGLDPSTTYHFRVRSSDADANLGTSDDDVFFTYTEGAQSLFDRMAVQPDAEHKGYIDQFFIDAEEVLEKAFVLYMVSGDQQASTLNWISADYTMILSGTVDFVPYRGFKGDGTFSGDTDFRIPAENQNSIALYGVVQEDQPNGTEQAIWNFGPGGGATGSYALRPNSSNANGVTFRLGGNASQVTTGAIGDGVHWASSRNNGTTYNRFRNGTTLASASSVSLPPPALDAVFMTASRARVSMAAILSGLTDEEVNILYFATNKYLAAIGAETLAVTPSATFALSMSPETLEENDTVTYTLGTLETFGTNAAGALTIEQSGGFSDSDFDISLVDAIENAVAGTHGVSFDGDDTLTFTNNFSGPLVFSREVENRPPVGTAHVVQISDPDTITILGPTAAALAGEPATPSNPSLVRGVNIAGAEFGSNPGEMDTDYFWPTEENIQYYADRNFTVVRVPFTWERVQDSLNSPLDVVGDGSGDFEHLQEVVTWITDRNMIALLDPHNYGNRKVSGTNYRIGSSTVPVLAFEDFWSRMADAFSDNDQVWFGLMNEPGGHASHWKTIAQSTTNAIRATGALNRIIVPGAGTSAAHTWSTGGNAAAMATYRDPANNYAFEVHQYLDTPNSGSTGTCGVGLGGTRLDPFITWASADSSRKGFLGEFAAGDPNVSGQAQCATELPALLDDVEGSGAFVGWSAWGGGENWSPTYHFRLEPVVLTDPNTPYMDMLLEYVP